MTRFAIAYSIIKNSLFSKVMGDGFASMCWQLEIKATNFAKERFNEI
ncbi:hypothetical protein ANACOL_01445 [Anaerotruncus colihominis DSM 17241]|uniref:Uncharacterized protein n=1 Tax=Anaerotruncus colihominis DSM 17241 TaxID=445972 RepID=B0P9H7_9FIRM|nr:hypothetical protein ANACOL_01445 [Anaerotruncus colihominis DSM 17241]